MPMDPTPVPAPATYPDQPRLVRWAHWLTFLGLLLPGLSVVGIVLAHRAKAAGEYGADKALRNALAVTGFLLLLLAAVLLLANL